jgi:predicted nucleic-acid-binding Zn-ribbon protein
MIRCPNCGYDALEERSGVVTGDGSKGAPVIKRWLECSNCGFTEGLVKPLIPASRNPAVNNAVRVLVWGGLMSYGLALGVFLGFTFGRGWVALLLLALPIIFAEILYDNLKGRLFGS